MVLGVATTALDRVPVLWIVVVPAGIWLSALILVFDRPHLLLRKTWPPESLRGIALVGAGGSIVGPVMRLVADVHGDNLALLGALCVLGGVVATVTLGVGLLVDTELVEVVAVTGFSVAFIGWGVVMAEVGSLEIAVLSLGIAVLAAVPMPLSIAGVAVLGSSTGISVVGVAAAAAGVVYGCWLLIRGESLYGVAALGTVSLVAASIALASRRPLLPARALGVLMRCGLFAAGVVVLLDGSSVGVTGVGLGVGVVVVSLSSRSIFS